MSSTITNQNGVAAYKPAASSSTASSSSGSAMQTLNANDFLTLMTAQLKNQDPLNPTDSNQFLSQLAQLSTVTGISQMNGTMSSLSSSLLSSQALSSASLVGRAVLTTANTATYSAGQPLGGVVQVPTGASTVTVNITDASGAVVRHLSMQATANQQAFSWDGKTDTGAAAPSGNYSISATTTTGSANQPATTLLYGTVSSVTLGNSGSTVTLNTPELGAVALSSVQQIG
jgi:flagellar basal-body rod modification protein FlgD